MQNGTEITNALCLFPVEERITHQRDDKHFYRTLLVYEGC